MGDMEESIKKARSKKKKVGKGSGPNGSFAKEDEEFFKRGKPRDPDTGKPVGEEDMLVGPDIEREVMTEDEYNKRVDKDILHNRIINAINRNRKK